MGRVLTRAQLDGLATAMDAAPEDDAAEYAAFCARRRSGMKTTGARKRKRDVSASGVAPVGPERPTKFWLIGTDEDHAALNAGTYPYPPVQAAEKSWMPDQVRHDGVEGSGVNRSPAAVVDGPVMGCFASLAMTGEGGWRGWARRLLRVLRVAR